MSKPKSKATPGPWRVNGRFIEIKESTVELPSFEPGSEMEANAALIAAAPDAIEACRMAHELLRSLAGEAQLLDEARFRQYGAAVIALGDAIAKAEGRE